MCHGGLDGPSAAPSSAIWGYASDPVRIGAHASHVAASPISPGFACDQCHLRPTDVFSPGHVNELTDAAAAPTATLTFGGLSGFDGAAPAWARASATCSNTYCHGATLAGGSNTAPSWTVLDGTQAACGTCHGLPPGGTHPSVDAGAGLAACAGCHDRTIGATGAMIAPASGGKHLDGIVEASGHPATWMDTANAGFHAYSANLGLEPCKSCHGQDLSGGSIDVACGKYRNLPPGVASWKTSCTMCHGGTDNQTGAPPRVTWGRSANPIRAGAHTLHVAKSVACGVCHAVPADALSAGHVDAATATVTFGGLALTGIPAGAQQPVWSRAAATCASTYCHGNFENGTAAYAPSWTAPAANACGTCHGLPPGGTHTRNPACGSCHDGYTATSVNAAKHVNGVVNVANLTCSSCHGESARPPTALNPQLAAAPPTDTLGNAGTSAPGVGAHGRHLTAGAIAGATACTECHAVPTSMSHANGVDDVAFGPIATARGALSPSWSAGDLTCASTYCHGEFGGGNAGYLPAWNRPAASVCGTCHGLPPGPPHPAVSAALTGCASCHSATMKADGTVDVASGKHLDGVVQRSGHSAAWMDRQSAGFHAPAANAGLQACQACHGAALDGVGPPGTASVGCAQCHGAGWATSCTMCHGGTQNPTGAPPRATWGNSADAMRVGAHTAHVTGMGLVAPLECGACHAMPLDAFGAGHITASPTASVNFGGIAGRGAPTWDRATGTCAANYCHGATLTGGTKTVPRWTGGGPEAWCGNCHGLAPPTGLHWHISVDAANCWDCHDLPGQPPLHVNGSTEVGGAILSWDGRSCTSACHGPLPKQW